MQRLHNVSGLAALAVALATIGVASEATADIAGDDLFSVKTLNPTARQTSCNTVSSAYNVRSAIVRGKTARVRIQRNLVDVGLEVADIRVASCDGKCDVKNVRKGGAPDKGFVELEIVAHNDAPLGSATLVLPYFGGGRGEYPLTIVRNSRIANVTSAVTGERTTRVSFTGTELNALLRRIDSADAAGGSYSIVSGNDNELVFDYTRRICTGLRADVELTHDTPRACEVRDISYSLAATTACAGAVAPAPAPAPAPPPAAGGGNAVRLNLTPQVGTPVPFFRSLSPSAADNTAARRQIANGGAFCVAMAADEERVVPLPAIRWGIGYSNLPAIGPVSVDVINADTGATLQRQTAAAITQGNGSDVRLFDNWTGRPTSVRVVNAQTEAKRRAMGASSIGGNAAPPPPGGCYLAPTEPLSRFDPPRLTIRVNTGTPPLAETSANDNEITL